MQGEKNIPPFVGALCKAHEKSAQRNRMDAADYGDKRSGKTAYLVCPLPGDHSVKFGQEKLFGAEEFVVFESL